MFQQAIKCRFCDIGKDFFTVGGSVFLFFLLSLLGRKDLDDIVLAC
jgi:hypothetical protein